jgi:hypothetical protein
LPVPVPFVLGPRVDGPPRAGEAARSHRRCRWNATNESPATPILR